MPIENKKQLMLIVVAIVVGAMATFATGKYVSDSIQQKTQELHQQYEAQQKQTEAKLMQASDQQMAAMRGAIDQVRQEQQQAIQQAQAAMQASQQAIAQQAQAAGQQQEGFRHNGTLLTTKTPSGKRAVTVMIDSLNAVGGLLNAGDFVDVIAHLEVPEQVSDKKKTVTAMVFQNVQVLAINTNLDNPGAYNEQQNAQSLKVTFAVDPQEAGLLAFANKNGKLELALRSSNENDKQMVKASTWKTLADYVLQNQGEAFKVPGEDQSAMKSSDSDNEKPEDSKPYIQIFRGGKEL